MKPVHLSLSICVLSDMVSIVVNSANTVWRTVFFLNKGFKSYCNRIWFLICQLCQVKKAVTITLSFHEVGHSSFLPTVTSWISVATKTHLLRFVFTLTKYFSCLSEVFNNLKTVCDLFHYIHYDSVLGKREKLGT